MVAMWETWEVWDAVSGKFGNHIDNAQDRAACAEREIVMFKGKGTKV